MVFLSYEYRKLITDIKIDKSFYKDKLIPKILITLRFQENTFFWLIS